MTAIREQYSQLLRELQREQCVLLIGPEILHINGRPFFPNLQQHLHDTDREKIPFYYSKDSLFVFRDGKAKVMVQGDVRTRLEKISDGNGGNNHVDETLFKKIAAIPFHLIISVNPDNCLSGTFAKYGVPHRFAYFDHNSQEITNIDNPDKHKPLIYNLFGSQEKDASLVLDYDDLFTLFQKLLVEPGYLPIKLKTKLRDAKSFLFLGFRFDRWYSQLLLRLLAGEQVINRFAIEPKPDDETCTFLARQMGVTFLNNNFRFFDLLYKSCEANNCLRDLVEIDRNPFKRSFFQLVQIGDYSRAMAEFRAYFKDKPQADEATLHLASYADWEKNINMGLLRENEAQVTLNRILYGALQLVKTVD